jgi:hypothetical protein
MPQEFQVLRCFSCETFQVDIVKKSNVKWQCKLCGEKQSIKSVLVEDPPEDEPEPVNLNPNPNFILTDFFVFVPGTQHAVLTNYIMLWDLLTQKCAQKKGY